MSQGYQILLSFPQSQSVSLIPDRIDKTPTILHTEIKIKNRPRSDKWETMSYKFLNLEWFINEYFPGSKLSKFAYHVSTRMCLGFILEHKTEEKERERYLFLLDKPVWVSIPKSKTVEAFLTSANAFFSFLTFIKNDSKNNAKFFFLNLHSDTESLREYITQIDKNKAQLRRIQALDASFCVI